MRDLRKTKGSRRGLRGGTSATPKAMFALEAFFGGQQLVKLFKGNVVLELHICLRTLVLSG